MEKHLKSDADELFEIRKKLIETEELIQNSSSISENLKNYVLFLIAKHDILLERTISEENSNVTEIPLIKM